MENWMERAKEAMKAIAQGREALAAVVDAVKDGKAALDVNSQAELNALLEQEKAETKAAYNNLRDAIAESRT